MLFDPLSIVQCDDVAAPSWTPPRQHPAARGRPANDFLTLPAVPADVPSRAVLTYRDAEDLSALVLSQFQAGVLRASDVTNPVNAGDAFAQAMFAWINARRPVCHRLIFDFALLELGAAQSEVSQFGWEDQLQEPLYLAIHLPQETVYVIGDERANALRAAHPALLFTAMSLISAADVKSVDLRTPSRLLDLFAMWHWDGDSMSDDEEARETMLAYGRDEEDLERYLPSTVRGELAPDDVLPYHPRRNPEAGSLTALSVRRLRALARCNEGWIAAVCNALADLSLELHRNGTLNVFARAQWAEPAYAAATIVFRENDTALEVLDDHINQLNASGEATLYQAFIPVATAPDAIREQFLALGGMLRIIGALDRVLTLISEEATWPNM